MYNINAVEINMRSQPQVCGVIHGLFGSDVRREWTGDLRPGDSSCAVAGLNIARPSKVIMNKLEKNNTIVF